MNSPLHPHNRFQGAPGISPHPPAQPARVVGGAGPAKRTHQEEPTLKVSKDRDAWPSMELLRRLNIAAGQLLDLIPPNPRFGRPYWLLDTRPRAGGSPLTHTGNTRPKFTITRHLGPLHLTVCVKPAGLPLVCRPADTIVLDLNAGGPELPGIYRLLPRSPR
ncbi:hypothetical protein GCM10027048_27880 [Hymenobacter coalescens]